MKRGWEARVGTAMRAMRRGMTAAILVGLSLVAAGCTTQKASGPPPKTTIPVVLGKVVRKTVPVTVSAIGNVEAYSTVSVRAQVSGELLEENFKEGDTVQKGQLLFTIDSRPYEAALAQARAALVRDKATAANNRTQAERYKKLLDEGVVPAQQVDSFISAADSSDAVVVADEAAIQTAELNVSYCKIYAPITGRTGSVMVRAGNLVKVSDVPMVVINQLIPVYVNFTVPQQTLPDVKRYMAQHPLTVEASIPSDSGPVERGTLTFIDNFVDSTTGTIHLKATFENPQNRLWPGLFVNTLMTLSEQPNAVTVPSQAVTSGQNNTQMVYVVKENNTVDARTVVSTRTIGPDAIIDSGLTPGETVVVDGQLRLVPGSRVQARNQPDDPPQGGGQQEQGARSKKGIDPPGKPDDPSGNSPARGAGKGGEEQPGSKS